MKRISPPWLAHAVAILVIFLGAALISSHYSHLRSAGKRNISHRNSIGTYGQQHSNGEKAHESISKANSSGKPDGNDASEDIFAKVRDAAGRRIPFTDFQDSLLKADKQLVRNDFFELDSMRVYLKLLASCEMREGLSLLEPGIIPDDNPKVVAELLYFCSNFGLDYMLALSDRLAVDWTLAFDQAGTLDRLPLNDLPVLCDKLKERGSIPLALIEPIVAKLFAPGNHATHEDRLRWLADPTFAPAVSKAAQALGSTLALDDNYQAAGMVLAKIDAPLVRYQATLAFFGAALEQKPAQTLSYITELEQQGLSIPEIPSHLLEKAGSALASQDPNSALTAIMKVSSQSSQEALMRGYLQTQAITKPRETALSVIANANQLNQAQLVGQMTSVMAPWIEKNTLQAVNFFTEAELHADVKVEVLRNSIQALARISPDAAIELMRSQNQEIQQRTASEYISAIMNSAPDAAYDLIKNLQDPSVRFSELQNYGQRMANKDAEIAIQLAANTTDPDERDALLSGIVPSVALSNFDEALSLANAIRNQTTKNVALANLYYFSQTKDPDFAGKLIQNSPGIVE